MVIFTSEKHGETISNHEQPITKDGAHASEAEDRAKKDEKGPSMAFWRIFSYGTHVDLLFQALSITAAMGSGVAVSLVNLVLGQFIGVFGRYGSGQLDGDAFMKEVSKFALYFVYIGIARLVLIYVYMVLSTYSAISITRNIRKAYFKAALSQSIAFFDQGTAGSIAVQASANGDMIQAGISDKLPLVFQALSTFIASFVIAFVTQWKLALIISCMAPAIMGIIATVAWIDSRIETKILAINSQAGSYAESILASLRTVHAFDIKTRLFEHFAGYLDDALRLGGKKSPIYGVMFSTYYFVIYSGMGLAYWQGINMLARGEVDNVGTIFTVLMAVIVASASLGSVAPNSVSFTRAGAAATQLFKLIDTPSSMNPLEESGERPGTVQGHVKLESITFSYPSRPGTKVLKNFSLDIPAGKVTALVGPSGSGKSTIVGLLERWYSANSGSIQLDGKNTNNLNLNWLRTTMRLVQQEPVLFNGTVFENIAHGLAGTPHEHAPDFEKQKLVEEAAKIAFAHDFVVQLPNGYQTRVGERGSLLSGGQKQRVAIARSVISSPRILLLDEATSALDPHAETIVQKALENVSRGRTTLVVAHKLATVRKADKIVVMSNGRIVEQGTHESLFTSGGAYARLVQAQSLATPESSQDDGCISSSATGEDTSPMKLEAEKTLTRYGTTEQRALDHLGSVHDFDLHQAVGMFSAMQMIVKATPELKIEYLVLLLVCVLGAAAYPGQTLLIGNIMSVFTTMDGERMTDRGNFFSLMFFVLGLSTLIIYFLLGWVSNVIAQTINNVIRRGMFKDFLRQDLQFFDRPENTVGALVSRLESGPQAIYELMGFNISLILIAILNVLGTSALAVVTSWKLGLVGVFAALPPIVGAGYSRIRLESRMDRDNAKRFSNSASIASESITAIRTVSSLAIESDVLLRYGDELDTALRLSLFPILHMMIWFALTQSIEYFILGLGFWWGCTLAFRGELTFYEFLVSFLGVFFSGQAVAGLFGYSSSLTKGKSAVDYYFWLQNLEPRIQESPENHDKRPQNGLNTIDFEHARFSYPLRPDTHVLRGIDLQIKPGQFVAFVGASGCGKSTMIALLERYYDTTSGSIRIDRENVTVLNPRLYRRQIALVQQEPFLYPGSIRENIAFGLDSAQHDTSGGHVDDSLIEAACRAANAWDFISSLPEGLQTPCGTSGSQLSGGQRQRIAIARALIRNPRVILLDEATSALDTESERVVQAAINEAAKTGSRITVSVAHRLSTVKEADLICVFHNGTIAEAGTHSQLLAQGRLYKQMCEAQNLD
ncbi:ABC transporter [Plectosphaerella cucumerina]|uniref:ABC transporter n=1 Tax=Plectosphaerella cucumerina TaxID=40658 RepID=A0A8K0TBP4_9PEZI|nr:ABC transporter [Plectosphaerella cucumerina]